MEVYRLHEHVLGSKEDLTIFFQFIDSDAKIGLFLTLKKGRN